MPQLTAEQTIADGQTANQLLNSEILLKAIEEIKRDGYERFMGTRDKQTVADIHAELRALTLIVEKLNAFALRGTIETKKQENRELNKNKR